MDHNISHFICAADTIFVLPFTVYVYVLHNIAFSHFALEYIKSLSDRSFLVAFAICHIISEVKIQEKYILHEATGMIHVRIKLLATRRIR